MKVFLTGITGYIGNKVALHAAEKGFVVHALVRDLHSPNIPTHDNIILHKGDITDKASVERAMYGCNYVIHLAGVTRLWNKDSSVFYKINVEGTRNVLEAAYHSQVKRLVFTSSCAVMGPSLQTPINENDPRIVAFENDYEISKHWAENLVKEYSARGLFCVIVSPPRVYGPGHMTAGNPINRMIKKIIDSGIGFMPANKNVLGNYAFIDDVVRGHFLALQSGLSGEKYILGGENISYETFYSTVRKLAYKKIRVVPVSRYLLKGWSFMHAFICNLAGRETHISPSLIDRLMQNRALSCSKAIRQLGYSITPFEDGMRQTILHLKNLGK